MWGSKRPAVAAATTRTPIPQTPATDEPFGYADHAMDGLGELEIEGMQKTVITMTTPDGQPMQRTLFSGLVKRETRCDQHNQCEDGNGYEKAGREIRMICVDSIFNGRTEPNACMDIEPGKKLLLSLLDLTGPQTTELAFHNGDHRRSRYIVLDECKVHDFKRNCEERSKTSDLFRRPLLETSYLYAAEGTADGPK
jgi:hypothetical protein